LNYLLIISRYSAVLTIWAPMLLGSLAWIAVIIHISVT